MSTGVSHFSQKHTAACQTLQDWQPISGGRDVGDSLGDDSQDPEPEALAPENSANGYSDLFMDDPIEFELNQIVDDLGQSLPEVPVAEPQTLGQKADEVAQKLDEPAAQVQSVQPTPCRSDTQPPILSTTPTDMPLKSLVAHEDSLSKILSPSSLFSFEEGT